ncbi:hypothetical protein CALVIDRAFT_569872 [Calocera viscosa TUFC12733]|uniref:Uncharacterized protein n=1 Tax=Calocera viscosa (strain TUFC12733) TaxID=1330018 RepID=A0A167FGS3_CALVF|nr:hypothetical protein CALVIDRAFT_569894 [Calocera viscosa TUFC12733]KZO89496.1 hypothetical protein CALVIDRAFT_569872 [Calocera viscosa TUFC12733]
MDRIRSLEARTTLDLQCLRDYISAFEPRLKARNTKQLELEDMQFSLSKAQAKVKKLLAQAQAPCQTLDERERVTKHLLEWNRTVKERDADVPRVRTECETMDDNILGEGKICRQALDSGLHQIRDTILKGKASVSLEPTSDGQQKVIVATNITKTCCPLSVSSSCRSAGRTSPSAKYEDLLVVCLLLVAFAWSLVVWSAPALWSCCRLIIAAIVFIVVLRVIFGIDIIRLFVGVIKRIAGWGAKRRR